MESIPSTLFSGEEPVVHLKVVLEVDGPSHFSANSHRPLGRTVGRRWTPLYTCLVAIGPFALIKWPLLRIHQAIHHCYENGVLSDAVHGLLVPNIALPWASCQCWLAGQQQLKIEHIKGCELSGTC